KRVLCINCYNKQNQGNHEDKVTDEHQKRDPEVSDEQTLEDFGDCRDGGGKGDSFVGVEGSDEGCRGGYTADGGWTARKRLSSANKEPRVESVNASLDQRKHEGRREFLKLLNMGVGLPSLLGSGKAFADEKGFPLPKSIVERAYAQSAGGYNCTGGNVPKSREPKIAGRRGTKGDNLRWR
ncbi:hypothetical protein HN873_067621, partial [Arachis hypogaea]